MICILWNPKFVYLNFKPSGRSFLITADFFSRNFRCHCPPGFSGRFCEQQEFRIGCDVVRCANGGQCLDSANGFLCFCPAGFNGRFCQKHDPRALQPGLGMFYRPDADLDDVDMNRVNARGSELDNRTADCTPMDDGQLIEWTVAGQRADLARNVSVLLAQLEQRHGVGLEMVKNPLDGRTLAWEMDEGGEKRLGHTELFDKDVVRSGEGENPRNRALFGCFAI